MEKSNNGLRVILFPLPLQGCINPMLQLANILHSRNFSITVIHTRFNAPKSSNHPHFDFLQIEDGVSETQDPTWNVMSLLAQINRDAKSPFHDCLQKLLLQSQESEKISCLIDDCGWLFTQSVSESLNLPRLVLSTFKATFLNGYPIIPLLRTKGYLPFSESEAEDSVFDFLPLKKRDLSKVLVGEYEEELYSFLSVTVDTTMRSSGIVFMSCEELEKDSLIRSNEIYKVPVFAVGPFHSYFSASSSSLFAQDATCVPWLDNQEDKSVIYVSLGSVVNISESEFLEIANGLNNSKQPFLWVVRPGLVQGVEWIKSLSEELLSSLGEKGKIVKWAPQQEVLAHRAIGGFLTHNGWNSTLESICEGVPMICLPGGWDQMLNSRFVSDVWKVGIHLEGRIERNEIEKAVRLLMTETEGRKFRERMNVLKDKVAGSVKHGGLSFRSIETLTNHILSL